ncbi:hypothetical protein O3P69_014311 [Scylla paramamosain]|uniref:Uncharacterized protein n=1 Tax=Scylla paramamosain TaxID=85552 RepID=A0AAW0TAI3_SCYPA
MFLSMQATPPSRPSSTCLLEHAQTFRGQRGYVMELPCRVEKVEEPEECGGALGMDSHITSQLLFPPAEGQEEEEEVYVMVIGKMEDMNEKEEEKEEKKDH